jgi:hypothetical protein
MGLDQLQQRRRRWSWPRTFSTLHRMQDDPPAFKLLFILQDKN